MVCLPVAVIIHRQIHPITDVRHFVPVGMWVISITFIIIEAFMAYSNENSREFILRTIKNWLNGVKEATTSACRGNSVAPAAEAFVVRARKDRFAPPEHEISIIDIEIPSELIQCTTK